MGQRLYDMKTKKQKMEYRKRNRHLVNKWSRRYRAKKRAENEEEYLKKNAKWQAQWRKDNPDKLKAIQKKFKNTKKYRAYSLKYNADNKDIPFELTYDEMCYILGQECAYCHGYNEDSINSIDRLDSEYGYTIEQGTVMDRTRDRITKFKHRFISTQQPFH